MKTPSFFLLLVLSSAAVPLQAQQTLTLQDVVTYASQRHPSVDLAQAATDRARSLVREVRAAQRPTANVDANLNRFQEPMVVAPLHGFDIGDVRRRSMGGGGDRSARRGGDWQRKKPGKHK